MAGDVEEIDSTWILALEAALLNGCDIHELIGITKGRILPEEHRAQIWYTCLGGGAKISNFSNFDEIFDLSEQSLIRSDCKQLVDKLGNDEEDKVSVICDMESIFTHYCKSRHLKYDPSLGWADIITPLLAVKMSCCNIYVCFEEILEKYIPRETNKGSPVFHLMRLLILYHDPQLCTYLDSKKITPDMFCSSWVRTLFSSVCALDVLLSLWDIYFQERDPFFVLFLILVIVINGRDQIMESKSDEEMNKISETLSNIPAALTVSDIPDFCSLARYYAMKTPVTFRKDFSTVIFGSVYMGKSELPNIVGDLPLSQALCLPVSVDEVLETSESSLNPSSDVDQVKFFLVDCRPSEQYNSGHLPNAFHIDYNLMLQKPTSFQTAVQGLLMAQKQAVASITPGCGNHLCFIGSGRETEDQYVHMVVASFLQRNTHFVSLAKGGYQAFHDVLVHNISENLADHDSKRCIVCCPEDQSHSDVGEQNDFLSEKEDGSSSAYRDFEQFSLRDKFSAFSSMLKTKPTGLKDRLVDYIKNPNAEGTVERHVSSRDQGRPYRDTGNVFNDPDADDHTQDQLEVVNISQWINKPDVIDYFACLQIWENGFKFPSYLLLTESFLLIIRESEGKKAEGRVTARRTLSSIVKITSKKKNPDFITFKYGSTLADGTLAITDMDRFLISEASEATKVIKQQILKMMKDDKT